MILTNKTITRLHNLKFHAVWVRRTPPTPHRVILRSLQTPHCQRQSLARPASPRYMNRKCETDDTSSEENLRGVSFKAPNQQLEYGHS